MTSSRQGGHPKTVDAYAANNTNRIVMWDKALGGTTTHNIKVVNLAPSGRRRIDIDALLETE